MSAARCRALPAAIRAGLLCLALAPVPQAVAADAPECQPVALAGQDWAQIVAARQAACAPARPIMRGVPQATPRTMIAVPDPSAAEPVAPPPPVVIAIYDPRVQFDFDRASLRPEAELALDVLAAFLNSPVGSAQVVEVQGHTDAKGDAEYNQVLSERRADAVRGYLIFKGVTALRLNSVGFGPRAPLPGTRPDDGINRRVQFRMRRAS